MDSQKTIPTFERFAKSDYQCTQKLICKIEMAKIEKYYLGKNGFKKI